MRNLYAIEYGAESADGDRTSCLDILTANSDEDADRYALDKAHRTFKESDGWFGHWKRKSCPYSLEEIVKFMRPRK